MTDPESQKVEVAFPSGDDYCRAWLFTPATERSPVIILGHGLGGTREMRLDAYARRFAAAGFAALAFTYRYFGDSGGRPRQLIDIESQLEDWAAAMSYARQLDGIDGRRIALWGSSFGGGHAIEAAARDGGVAAVVSQCPFTDGFATLRSIRLQALPKLAMFALRDELARLGKRQPVYIPLVGSPGDTALLTAPDCEAGYHALAPDGVHFENKVAARVINRAPFYRPGRSAAKVTAPILFCVCEDDSVAPAATTLKWARTAPRGEVKNYPIGHFDIYFGEPFECSVADQVSFLRRHLCSASPAAPATERKHG